MDKSKYNMSFTSGGLFYIESLQVLSVYEKALNWQETYDRVVADNVLQSRTEASAKKRAREICFRLQCLTPLQLRLLGVGSPQEQCYLLWLAICKHHRFIAEFATKVVREKYLRFDFNISYIEYDMFFEDVAEWHPEIDNLSASTKSKLRQVLFKIMREAHILSSDNIINPVYLTPEFTEAIVQDDQQLLSVFPVNA